MTTAKGTAVITGASQGIGAGLVQAYRGRGYRVVANSRSVRPSDDPDLVAVAGDVADQETGPVGASQQSRCHALEQCDQHRMTPSAVARWAHDLPVGAIGG